jgi:hypothetical protein
VSRKKQRIRCIGGRHDGGEVEDLGKALQWIDDAGQSHDDLGPGTLYVRRKDAQRRDALYLVEQIHAQAAIIALANLDQVRERYDSSPVGDWSFEEYVDALVALASVAAD